MTFRMQLNALWQRWMGRGSRQFRRRRLRQRPCLRPRLEALEDRTLLSALGAYSFSVNTPSDVSQFGGGTATTQSGSAFLGVKNINVSGQVGGISSGPLATGAELNYSLSATAGLQASYSVSSGTVNASYNDTLNQNYVEPTQFNQEVDFTPQNTNISYATSSNFSTTAPSATAGANLIADLNGSIGGEVAFLGATAGGSTSFSTNLNQPLISASTTNGLEIFGAPATQGVTIPVEIAPGITIDVTVGQSGAGVAGTFDLEAGEVFKNDDSLSASVNLGNASLSLPSIDLNSSSDKAVIQSNGVLKDSGGSTFASIGVQMGPLVAALLGQPEAGALASTDNITLGPFTLSVTPLSFLLGPDLSLAQTGTVTPTNQLTYSFYTDSTEKTAMKVDVTKDGTDLGSVPSVKFTPGVDTIGIKFGGQPITVQPTLTSGLNFTNEINLDAGIQGTLTVGEVDATASLGKDTQGNLGTLSLGPLYQKTFDLADATLATIYDKTFSIASQTQTLHSFVIGSTFTPSLNVRNCAKISSPKAALMIRCG